MVTLFFELFTVWVIKGLNTFIFDSEIETEIVAFQRFQTIETEEFQGKARDFIVEPTKEVKMKSIDFGAFRRKMQMPTLICDKRYMIKF